MSQLLVVGPSGLETHGEFNDLCAGWGLTAAIAATPTAPTILWSDLGSDFPNQTKAMLAKQRHLKLDGCSAVNPTVRRTAAERWPKVNSVLGDIVANKAEDVGATLAIDLPPGDWATVLHAHHQLTAEAKHPLIVCPGDQADPDNWPQAAERAWLLIASTAQASRITGETQPVRQLKALQAMGAKAVALTAGPLGGLIAYKDKISTWPTVPNECQHDASTAIFAGVTAGIIGGSGKSDFRTLKRALVTASAVTAKAMSGPATRQLMQMKRSDYEQAFTRLRRLVKPS